MSRSPRIHGKIRRHKPEKFYAMNEMSAAVVRHGKFCSCCWLVPMKGFKQFSHRFIRRRFKLIDRNLT